RELPSRARHEDVHVLLPVRVREIVDARARHPERIARGVEHVHHHPRVLLLAPRLGSVLAIAGHVEDAPRLRLQLERLADGLLAAREVLARGDRREGFLAGEEGVALMRGGGGQGGVEKGPYSSFWIMSASASRRLAALTWCASISRPFTTTVPRPSRFALSSASITSSAAARPWSWVRRSEVATSRHAIRSDAEAISTARSTASGLSIISMMGRCAPPAAS